MNLIDTYSTLTEAFDSLAPAYDETYGPEANLIMGWLRQENLELLRGTFRPGSRLLEIGCGTGDEAIALAQYGCHITATDISPAMTATTRNKAEKAGLARQISTRSLGAAQLHELEPDEPYDGAFASFGSLNCEPDLEGLAASLAQLLSPGASFICSIMSRFSLFETVWYLSHGQLSGAFRRQRSGWQMANINIGGEEQMAIPVRYLSAGDVEEFLSPGFKLVRTISLGLLLPPPYLDNQYRARQDFWNRLMPLDRQLRDRWPWKHLGDHAAATFLKL